MDAEYAVVGRVRKPHGLHGELVVELFTDEPDAVFAPGRRVFTGDGDAQPTGSETTITRGRPFKDTWLVTLKDVADRDAADLLRGAYLLQPSSDLRPPTPDQLYIHDLSETFPLTPGPGATLGREFVVDLPRPRDRQAMNHDSRFKELRNDIVTYLGDLRENSRKRAREGDRPARTLPGLVPADLRL